MKRSRRIKCKVCKKLHRNKTYCSKACSLRGYFTKDNKFINPMHAGKSVMEILPEYLNKIKDGSKRLEFRSWYGNLKFYPLKNTETNKIEAVIEISSVEDTYDLNEEDRNAVLDLGHVSEEFRTQYDCRYCYVIKKVYNVH